MSISPLLAEENIRHAGSHQEPDNWREDDQGDAHYKNRVAVDVCMSLITSRTIGRVYKKVQIGFGPISYFLSFIGFMTFAKVWQSDFENMGIPFILVIVVLPILIAVCVFILGHIMYVKKVQEAMTSLDNTEGNIEFTELCKTVKEIRRKMDE